MTAKKNDKPDVEIVSKKSVEERLDSGAFLSRVILEMVGKPKKHVTETLHEYVAKISTDSRYSIVEYEIEEPTEVEGNKEMFSTFAEVEFLSKDAVELMNFVVDYMPSSVEVIQPANVNLQANFFSNLMTELVGRLHLIDGAFKEANAKSQLMSKSLGIMIQNSIMILLNLGPRDAEGISKTVGVDAEQCDFFLKKLVEDGKIEINEETNKYSLKKK